MASDGWQAACSKTVRRSFGLLLIGLVLYGLDGNFASWSALQNLGAAGFVQTAFQREYFQTLTHIGLTTLWILPVIALNGRLRLIYGIFSLAVFTSLSHGFYFEWAVQRPVIDGGPLGFLSWSAPMLAGSWAHDWVEGSKDRRLLLQVGAAGIGLMLLGYGLSCLGDGASLWEMRQRASTVSYQTFGAGVSLLVFAGFVWLFDGRNWQSGFLKTFGTNALLAYILDGLISEGVLRWTPMDAPAAHILLMLSVQAGLCYLILRTLERKQIFLRL